MLEQLWFTSTDSIIILMISDKISTSLALDSLHKIRVSWVKNQVSARSDAQICFLS